MAIRLVALDMDGTLLNSGKELPPDFLPWVKAHPDILTVIGSGRPRGGLRDYFDENLQMVYLCDNGAMVYRGEQLLFSQPMPLPHVSSILTFLAGHQGVVPVISSAGCAYV
ncbi:MAG: HAD family phosphatase, partial [Clostridia bacterium]|nr:HAD family phosphatase [Clostridia bacterium]